MTRMCPEDVAAIEARAVKHLQTPKLRVLVVAPYFAPSAIVGAKRFSFLSEKFEKLGYEVDTLTIRWRRDDQIDTTLPVPGRVHRIACVLPHEVRGDGLLAKLYNRIVSSVICVPDNFVGWLPASLAKGLRIAKRIKPNIIIATGPPFTAFLTGVFLSKATGVPLVLDYRDPWSLFDWSDSRFGKRMKGRPNRFLERWAVGHASALVFTSGVMRERFEANYVGIHSAIVRVITNGFNEPSDIAPASLTPDAINILYAGSFYGQRRLCVLIDALEQLQSRPGFGNLQFSIHIFGSLLPDDRHQIAKTGLKHAVHEHAQVDHKTILNFMRAADILYLPSGSHVTYALPFKVFDYLSVRRPILAVTPAESAVARLVSKLDCGEVAEDMAAAVADALGRILRRQQEYKFSNREKYTWASIAGRYSQLMEELVAGSK